MTRPNPPNPTRAWACALALVYAASPAAARAEEPRKLTLSEVVDLAARQSTGVRVAEQGVEAAEQRVEAAQAQLLPRLRTEGNVFYWDKALLFGGMAIREQLSASLSLSIAQPLTGLLALLEVVQVEKRGLDVAATDRQGAKLDAAQRAAEAFLRALQARALLDVAEKSQAQVDAQLERARVLEKSGVLGTVDVLRLESARAATAQAVLRARSGVAISDRSLALTLSLDPATPLQPVDDLPAVPPKVELLAPAAQKRAAEARPELEAARINIQRAEGGKKIASSGLYPNIIAVATYQHTEGQGLLFPKDAAFAGATLSWDLFEWGKTIDQMEEAEANIERAKLAAEATEQLVAFDVERRLLEAGTSHETLGVAESGLRAAEEAHRIQSVRYQQGAATTTDVLDAETELARARTNYASARFEYYIALSALARALGNLPGEIGSP